MADISKIMGIELAVVSPPPYVWRDTFDNGDNWYLSDVNGVTRFANSKWEIYQTNESFMGALINGYDSPPVNGKWHLVGDFDLIVDVDITSVLSPTTFSYFLFRLYEWTEGKSAENLMYYIRGNGAGGLEYYEDSDTNWGTLTTGSFRLRTVRSGAVVTLYAWHNNRWEWNGSTSGRIDGGTWNSNVGVHLQWYGVGSASYIMGGVNTVTLVTGNKVNV